MQNSLLSRFTPKEPKFFDFMKEVAEIGASASNLLLEALQVATVEQRQDYFAKIKEKEHAADLLSNKIFEALESTFITPFDREDVHELSNRLDDVIDLINSCSKRIAIYNPHSIHPCAIELGKIIVKDAQCINEAMDKLATLRKNAVSMKKDIEELHILENKADEIYESAITEIFANETNAIELMKNKEILNELEKATDAAEHVGKIIKTIIVKYA